MKQKYDCGFYLKHINDALQRDCNNALRNRDLTISQLTVLLLLDDASAKELPLKTLEKELHVAQSTAAGIIVRLEQKKFVESYGHPQDRRVKMVRILPAGSKCCETAQLLMCEKEKELLSPLDESERVTFFNLLKRVSENMN